MVLKTCVILYGILAAALGVAARRQIHSDVLKNAPPGIHYKMPKPMHPRSSSMMNMMTKPSQHVQQLRSVEAARPGMGMINTRSAAAVLGAHQRHAGGYGYENVTSTSAYGTQYAVEVLWDGHPVSLILDTGSSDTWAVHKDFHCVDYSGQFVPQEACAFGAAYPESTFRHGATEPEMHMYIQYGDGEVVTGPMGFSDITVGNVTVKKQQVCLANATYWFGNNYTSGLMGLAFPSLTNAYLGDPSHHDFGNQVQYSPLFTSMVSQGLVDPVFSIAIDRNASTGMLALGGVAPVSGLDPSRSATLDMVIVSWPRTRARLPSPDESPPLRTDTLFFSPCQTTVIPLPASAYEYSFYTVIPDGWYYDFTTNTRKIPYIVDSGTTLCYLPPSKCFASSVCNQPTPSSLSPYPGSISIRVECSPRAPVFPLFSRHRRRHQPGLLAAGRLPVDVRGLLHVVRRDGAAGRRDPGRRQVLHQPGRPHLPHHGRPADGPVHDGHRERRLGPLHPRRRLHAERPGGV